MWGLNRALLSMAPSGNSHVWVGFSVVQILGRGDGKGGRALVWDRVICYGIICKLPRPQTVLPNPQWEFLFFSFLFLIF